MANGGVTVASNVMNLRKFDDKYTMCLNVKLTREFRFRIWLGMKLIKLGVRITGMGVEVNEEIMEV